MYICRGERLRQGVSEMQQLLCDSCPQVRGRSPPLQSIQINYSIWKSLLINLEEHEDLLIWKNMKTKQTKMFLKDESLCHTPMPLIEANSILSPNEEVNFKPPFSKLELETEKPMVEHESEKEKDKNTVYVKPLMRGLGEVGEKGQICIYNKKMMIESEIPAGIMISTILRKSKNKMSTLLSPEYSLELKSNHENLLHIKNYPLSSEIFRFSTSKDFSHKNPDYQGSMFCNLSEGQFWLQCPVSRLIDLDTSLKDIEQLRAYIEYCKKTKKMKTMTYYGDPNFLLVIRKKDPMHYLSKLSKEDNLNLKEKKGDSKQRKEFALQDEDEDDYEYIKFSQMGPDEYSLEIQHPLSIMQGIAIAMTRFEACLK